MDSHSENSENHARHCPGEKKKVTNPGRCQVISIDMLPDDVLPEIFDIYLDQELNQELDLSLDEFGDTFSEKEFEAVWQPLVHVCRRWRSIVFGSPRRLNLHLICTGKTPARDTLDVWPALPISVSCDDDYRVENIIAVLERRRDHVYKTGHASPWPEHGRKTHVVYLRMLLHAGPRGRKRDLPGPTTQFKQLGEDEASGSCTKKEDFDGYGRIQFVEPMNTTCSTFKECGECLARHT